MGDSIIGIGVTFAAYMFLMLVFFYILGGPIDTLFDGIIDSSSISQMASYAPNYKFAARIAFAIGITTPVFWAVAKVFSREPTDFTKRRY